ncbi:MAG: hypothetical protein IJP48_07390 [Synergistaceae bacterium]|nr:hypothetical protein [Synergistaceae bacterium]
MKKELYLAVIIIFALNIFACSSYAGGYPSSELLNMTLESLRCDFANNTAYVRGVGVIHDNNAHGKLLARRAALTDARRGLLILKHEIESGKKFTSGRIKTSGHVPALKILSESQNQEQNLYFVEVQAALSELLRNKDYINMLTGL